MTDKTGYLRVAKSSPVWRVNSCFTTRRNHKGQDWRSRFLNFCQLQRHISPLPGSQTAKQTCNFWNSSMAFSAESVSLTWSTDLPALVEEREDKPYWHPSTSAAMMFLMAWRSVLVSSRCVPPNIALGTMTSVKKTKIRWRRGDMHYLKVYCPVRDFLISILPST